MNSIRFGQVGAMRPRQMPRPNSRLLLSLRSKWNLKCIAQWRRSRSRINLSPASRYCSSPPMSKLFERTDGIACRACGAASARSVHETFKDAIFDTVCDVCWRRFSQYCENQHKTATEDLFNRWLARQLFMDVRRLKHYGVAGRCEA